MQPKFKIFAISGGTASGKTTLAKDLCSCAIEFGLTSTCISMDNFYKKFNMPIEERKLINFDHPDSFDVELLVSCIKELIDTGETKIPTYDFKVHNRTDIVSELTRPHLLIVEGILTLHYAELRSLYSHTIFVDTSDELRLNRKLVRDVAERGRTADYSFQQWLKYSQPMFEKYCLPSSRYADLMFSGQSWTIEDVQKILLDHYLPHKYS